MPPDNGVQSFSVAGQPKMVVMLLEEGEGIMPQKGSDYDDGEKNDGSIIKKLDEFDCPLCSANNPYDDGFKNGDCIRCFYCGAEFDVRVKEDGTIRLRET